jgi:hypothetical protein
MRRLTFVVTLLLTAAGFTSAAQGAISAAQLRTANVVFDTGVQRSDADRARLEQTARDLGAKGFRTKFAVVATHIDKIDALARQLRKELGDSAVEAVLVLGPRQLGVDAKVFACEKQLALDAEVATLTTDDLQGTINVANRLQAFHQIGALRDSNCKDIGGPTTKKSDGVATWLVALLVTIGIVGIAGFMLARRAAKRAEARRAGETTSREDEPPPGP